MSSTPLLEPGRSAPPPATPDVAARREAPTSATSRAHAHLRRIAANILSQHHATNTIDPGRPNLSAAAEYMRHFLPKTADGKLLPLGCSESEFAQHVGSGVAIYMSFVKVTMWMFVLASVIALPQFFANATGTNLELAWPLDSEECPNLDLVSRVMSTFQFYLYAFMLGNVSFPSTYGFPHLISELLLSSMFCVYVFLVMTHIHQEATSSVDIAKGVRASDFAVMVSKLPARGSDPQALRQHFSFFGDVASVAVSNDHHRLLGLVQKHQRLKARWRNLHLEYGRARRALTAASTNPSGVQLRAESSSSKRSLDRLLLQIERLWGEMLQSRRELRLASSDPAVCTGRAVIIFRELRDAAKCVRHFDLIRRHERARDGGSLGALDFRQLYFRTAHKLEVARAPEPSDILWENHRASRLQRARQDAKTWLIIILIVGVSTALITITSLVANGGFRSIRIPWIEAMSNKGLLTTLWSTPLIILSNVVIFISVPQLSIHVERHNTRSAQHFRMLLKMFGFQLLNTVIACASFMFMFTDPPSGKEATCPLLKPPELPKGDVCFDPSPNGDGWKYLQFDEQCVRHWYTTGAVVLINAVVGDLTAILLFIEFIRPDALIVRYLVAPRAPTQSEMNQIYALDSELYLPFRYQLVLKMVFIAFTFCSAIPALLPIAALFMYLSLKIDRYNFLRVFKPPPFTTDRPVTSSVQLILPLAAFCHILFAIFFYSKQANQKVPVVYYLTFCLLMIVVMVRISGEVRMQFQRPAKEPERREDEEDEEEAELSPGSKPSQNLAAHLDAIELYVPPLTAELLKAAWSSKARAREMDPSVSHEL